jgi:signal transduction histidine kinase
MFVARTLVPIGFVIATLRLRSAPGPLGPVATGLENRADGTTVGQVLRTALGDPSLELLRAAESGTWTDEDGRPAVLPNAGAGRALTRVGRGDRPLAALVHDPALLEQPELVEAVVGVLRLALENERLETVLRDQLLEVTESRQRIVSAAEAERRRVERDLHDGAQQRLVGVMLALQEARGAADAAAVPATVRSGLDAAAAETTEAIRELRELARGIHPAILEDEGLGAAVAALARRAGIPVDLQVTLDGRLPRLVESTAYFTIAEALTNTQRHARASTASVRLAHTGAALELEVIDDGQGGAEADRGSGLRGLADRVMAVGGRLEIDSVAGRGTSIRATIPVPAS